MFQKWYNKLEIKNGLRDDIICADGFQFSCQQSDFHHCDKNTETFEIGFPNKKESLLKEFEDLDDNRIFNYVDSFTIGKIINKHGGLK